MSEWERDKMSDHTPSMDDIAEYYTACRMRGYDEVQGGEPYAIVRARYKEGFNHVIAAHDKELREQIARDIEARKPRASKLSEYVTGVRRGIYLAARIARGETGEVKRCLQCGCDLWYPTAAHVVDCGTRKEQD